MVEVPLEVCEPCVAGERKAQKASHAAPLQPSKYVGSSVSSFSSWFDATVQTSYLARVLPDAQVELLVLG